ncbi:MAG: methyltransferase domain-containing protein [Alphaproteobacteria bacterium]|nr:methyltransferase domain-containing protein [Alphaproteobacteria bacterium]
MYGISNKDPGRSIDWSRTSGDYAQHRPGPPQEFFLRLAALGVGLPGQRILDLATGTGLLARQFARQNSRVAGIDIASGQIDAARRLAAEEGLDARFEVAPAEAIPFAPHSFDAATANQCWLYFDPDRTLAELRRVLVPGGVLVTSHFSWLPRVNAIAAASEALVLKFNPAWTGGDWPGTVPPVPAWAAARGLDLRAMFWFDAPIRFTAESWRGRMRACRGVGATLDESRVAEFDAAHADLLARTAPPEFEIVHRIDAHIFGIV